jgi:hypothetical protein
MELTPIMIAATLFGYIVFGFGGAVVGFILSIVLSDQVKVE